MTYKISGYKPEAFFRFFEDFSAVPRGSGFEKGASDFLVQFAKDRSLDVTQDAANNVVIRKPGSRGAEEKPPVIMQGHMDMVCEKVAGCDHDFHKEGIDMSVTDGWLTANGTTLGGDDGIADALMMTVLDDDSLAHPPLECVFTTGEEVGLVGANALDFSALKGRTMINIDSETEGIITVSCAGGMDYKLTKQTRRRNKKGSVIRLGVKGLLGGHSGTDIDKERVNGIRLTARVLNRLLGVRSAQLVQFVGGTKDNAIPREAEAAVLFTNTEDTDEAMKIVSDMQKAFENEILPTEPNFEFSFTREDNVKEEVLSKEDGRALVSAVLLAPNGVRRRDLSLDNFVLTSLNLGIVTTEEDEAKLVFAPRSSVDSLQDYTKDLLQLTADTFGFTVSISGAYPGWEKVADSKLRDTFVESYRELFGDEIKVEGIHAGLECGLFYAAMPGLDPVSIGPTMEGVHTPDEKMDLSSAARTYSLVTDVLRRLAAN